MKGDVVYPELPVTFLRSTLGLLSLALAASGCAPAPDADTPGAPGEERQRWEAAALQDYRFDFQQQCFCVLEQVQPVTVEVRDGRVTRVVSRETGQDLTAVAGLRWYTVPDLFQVIEEARAAGVTPLEVRYDPALGYPTRIEAGSLAADAGVVYTAANLEPLDPAPGATR